MRIRHQGRLSSEKIELQMTPMIDIVFQLLVFFILSFKIVVQEGDFNVKMPLSAPSTGMIDEQLPPMQLKLSANADGSLAAIQLNDQSFTDFLSLRQHVLSLLGTDEGPGSLREQAELEIDADYNLRYEYVIESLTAVTGYREGDQVVKLIEKIRFTPPEG